MQTSHAFFASSVSMTDRRHNWVRFPKDYIDWLIESELGEGIADPCPRHGLTP